MLVLAPAGSRVQDEALGFWVGLWPVTPALLCSPRGSRLLQDAPHLHPCKLAFSSGLSCFSFLSPYRALLVSPSPNLPFLVSRFRDPTSLLVSPSPNLPFLVSRFRDPTSLLAVSTVALTIAKVDPRLPACCVHPPVPCFP